MILIRALLVLAAVAALAGCGPAKAQSYQSLGAATLAVTTSTASVALPAGQSGNVVMLLNVTTQEVFVRLGTSTVTAATTDESIPGNAVRCFARGASTHVAGIVATGTTTLRVSQGVGPCSVAR